MTSKELVNLLRNDRDFIIALDEAVAELDYSVAAIVRAESGGSIHILNVFDGNELNYGFAEIGDDGTARNAVISYVGKDGEDHRVYPFGKPIRPGVSEKDIERGFTDWLLSHGYTVHGFSK